MQSSYIKTPMPPAPCGPDDPDWIDPALGLTRAQLASLNAEIMSTCNDRVHQAMVLGGGLVSPARLMRSGGAS